jgi:pathogenesis-related protein 1
MKLAIVFGVFTVALATHRAPEPESMIGMTARHNHWREQVGQPPMEWSEELAAEAQEWANELAKRGCQMEHRPSAGKWGTRHGENIFWAYNMRVDPHVVVDSWADERKFYQSSTGKCKGGVCGHYTQIVWKSTQRVGCGMARCGDEQVWVCNYDPPGNFIGEKAY